MQPCLTLFIRQTIAEAETAPPKRVIVVMDCSGSMRQIAPEIANSFKNFPTDVEFAVVPASIETDHQHIAFQPQTRSTGDSMENPVGDQIRALDCRGGQDNVTALNDAWELAAEKKGSVILWIHGPLPVILGETAFLKQKWDRRPERVQVYGLQAVKGPNRLLETFDF